MISWRDRTISESRNSVLFLSRRSRFHTVMKLRQKSTDQGKKKTQKRTLVA